MTKLGKPPEESNKVAGTYGRESIAKLERDEWQKYETDFQLWMCERSHGQTAIDGATST
jgi:hypothetical protein